MKQQCKFESEWLSKQSILLLLRNILSDKKTTEWGRGEGVHIVAFLIILRYKTIFSVSRGVKKWYKLDALQGVENEVETNFISNVTEEEKHKTFLKKVPKVFVGKPLKDYDATDKNVSTGYYSEKRDSWLPHSNRVV